MNIKKITQNNQVIASVYFYTDYDKKTAKTADRLLNAVVDRVLFNPKISYAGFSTKKSLRKHLKFQIFGENKKFSKGHFPLILINENEILRVIKNALKKSFSVLKSDPIWIFVFPTFNPFVKKKMEGVTGSSFWKNTILLFVYPKVKRWQTPLIYTIAHEFTHSVELKYFPISSSTTLLDALIFEGRANNFAALILKCKPRLGARVLDKSKSKKIFKKIQQKNLLRSTSRKLYYSVFFEGKKYPFWTGYALGYQIVKSFLKKHPKMKKEKIIKLPPKEILEKSGF